jgi:4-aminobutyrate aminotransferase-like enzyme
VNTVLRFMPPLIISEEEIDQLIDALDAIFQKR